MAFVTAYGYEINSFFVEMMNDYGFEQFVTQPTRDNHLLDLVLSTDSNIIENVQEYLIMKPSLANSFYRRINQLAITYEKYINTTEPI